MSPLSQASPVLYAPFWPYSENRADAPCRCCNPTETIENGWWKCQQTRQEWYIVEPSTQQTCWADIADEEFAAIESTITPQQRAKREQEAAELAAARALAAQANRMFCYAEDQKHLNSRGKGRDRHIDKVDSPCKFLYCDEKAPKSQWTTNAKGERCAPMRQGLTGSECWAHEYHDPRSKALLKPHSCKHLHPNEDGWRDEWDSNRSFRPAKPSAADSFFTQRMSAVVAPKPVAPKAQAPRQWVQREERSAW